MKRAFKRYEEIYNEATSKHMAMRPTITRGMTNQEKADHYSKVCAIFSKLVDLNGDQKEFVPVIIRAWHKEGFALRLKENNLDAFWASVGHYRRGLKKATESLKKLAA